MSLAYIFDQFIGHHSLNYKIIQYMLQYNATLEWGTYEVTLSI